MAFWQTVGAVIVGVVICAVASFILQLILASLIKWWER